MTRRKSKHETRVPSSLSPAALMTQPESMKTKAYVYGVDKLDRILVDEQDNCKKGCPACSRVCPENAIIFPGHKSSSIAGAEGEVGDLKIDLSKLFGAPDALEMAVRERDVELVADGRDAVGMSVGIPKRQADAGDEPRDRLDDLIDGLDDLDL